MKQPDIIIIGGGVIGLACAHYLNRDGMRVTVIDQDRIGSGASHGNCGLLYFTDVIPLCAPGVMTHELGRMIAGTSPLYIKPELSVNRLSWLFRFAGYCRHTHKSTAAANKLDLLNYSARLFSELFSDEPFTDIPESKGILSVFRSEKNWEQFKATNDFIKRFLPGYQQLTADQALDLEPALRPDIAGAWYNRSDQHLRPDTFVAQWKKDLSARGVVFMENCRVRDVHCHKGHIRQVITDRGCVSPSGVVLAAGAWSPLLGKRLGLDLPVEPGKGYSITMAPPEACPAIPCMLYERNMVVTPFRDGLRLGGTMEFSGYDLGLTPKRLAKLRQGAAAYLKGPLGTPVIEEWTSLRPMAVDDMPIISRSPAHANLVVATGHGMLGLTLATGTGKLVSDMIQDKKPQIPEMPYALTRF